MDKVLALMFRCCGISPSGTHIDKYYAITAIILIIVIPLRRIIVMHVANGSIEGSSGTVIRLVMTAATVVLIISNWIKPQSYRNIMKGMESTGNQVQCTNGQRIVSITCIIAALAFVQAVFFYQTSFYIAVYLVVDAILNNGPSLQHMFMVERIQKRFSALNDLVARIDTDTSLVSTEIDYVFQQHSSLQALVVDVDLHFCFFNLFSYLSKFSFCVTEMYGYLVSIENDNRQMDCAVLISFIKQVVFGAGQALVCHACSKEANRTVLLAHRVLKPNSPLDLWKQVGLFSQLAVDNKVHFTVGGIFTMDRGLITQTALTALAYLIIAVQLREIKLF